VTFSSSDPLAILPGPYTFTAEDAGIHSGFEVTFHTLGNQTVTITDSANGLTTSAPMRVVGQPSGSIPATTPAGRIALVGLLAIAGSWVISKR
jgi:hypothetical protein